MSEEEWRDVGGYEGRYQISSLGRIRSIPRKGVTGGILRLLACGDGYFAVSLYKDGTPRRLRIHRLVAEAFLGARPEGLQIRHLDGNPRNNVLTNLAYGTPSENLFDCVAHGRHHERRKTHCPKGHEYTPENTRFVASRPGSRYCRACGKERDQNRATKKPGGLRD